MDARELFQEVVSPNYREFIERPNDIRLLWNALVSMNSVAEYLALERLKYASTSRQVIRYVADKVRQQYDLEVLELCADKLKHLRKTSGSRAGFEVTAISTGVSSDPSTWMIGDRKVVDVLKRATETGRSVGDTERGSIAALLDKTL
jgi:hypothetical protein